MYKFFLLLSISDFSLFLCKNCKAFLFPSNPLSSKNGDPEKTTPSLFENLIGRSPPSPPPIPQAEWMDTMRLEIMLLEVLSNGRPGNMGKIKSLFTVATLMWVQ